MASQALASAVGVMGSKVWGECVLGRQSKCEREGVRGCSVLGRKLSLKHIYEPTRPEPI